MLTSKKRSAVRPMAKTAPLSMFGVRRKWRQWRQRLTLPASIWARRCHYGSSICCRNVSKRQWIHGSGEKVGICCSNSNLIGEDFRCIAVITRELTDATGFPLDSDRVRLFTRHPSIVVTNVLLYAAYSEQEVA